MIHHNSQVTAHKTPAREHGDGGGGASPVSCGLRGREDYLMVLLSKNQVFTERFLCICASDVLFTPKVQNPASTEATFR